MSGVLPLPNPRAVSTLATPTPTTWTFLDVASLAIPLTIAFDVSLVGRLFLAEVLLLAILPFVLMTRRGRPFDRAAQLIVLVGLVWLWSQIVTDIYRDTTFLDYARGWMKIAFTLSSLVALYALLIGRARRILLFACGLSVGFVVEAFAFPAPLTASDPWKFGYAFPATLLIAAAASTRRVGGIAFLPALALGAAALLNMRLGFRSLGGVCVLSAAYLFLHQLRGHGVRPLARLSLARLIAIAAATVALGVAVILSYGSAAKDGLLGDVAAQKYQQQSSGRFGVLLAGRPELLGALPAIGDSPIIGHGSWARDPKYVHHMLAELTRLGYAPLPRPAETFDLIPSHSHLLGAWVEAGIAGAAFWLIVIGIAISVLAGLYRIRVQLAPLIVFLAFLLVWNILFSPYGAQTRVIAPFSIVVLLTARARLRLGNARPALEWASRPEAPRRDHAQASNGSAAVRHRGAEDSQ